MAPLLSIASATLLFLSAAHAHFQVQYPPTIGPFNDDKEADAPCGGYTPDFAKATDFHVGGDAIATKSGHPQTQWLYRITTDDKAAGNWSQIHAQVLQSGVGTFCLPRVAVPESYVGQKAVLSVVANGDDGLLYQVCCCPRSRALLRDAAHVWWSARLTGRPLVLGPQLRRGRQRQNPLGLHQLVFCHGQLERRPQAVGPGRLLHQYHIWQRQLHEQHPVVYLAKERRRRNVRSYERCPQPSGRWTPGSTCGVGLVDISNERSVQCGGGTFETVYISSLVFIQDTHVNH